MATCSPETRLLGLQSLQRRRTHLPGFDPQVVGCSSVVTGMSFICFFSVFSAPVTRSKREIQDALRLPGEPHRGRRLALSETSSARDRESHPTRLVGCP